MLTNNEIKKQIDNGKIKITNMRERDLSKPNSCKVRMIDFIFIIDESLYKIEKDVFNVIYGEINTGNFKYLKPVLIPDAGLELKKGTLYITRSQQEIYVDGYVPFLYGKTLLSTKGVSIDTNNSFYQDHFSGFLLLSIICTKNTIVYPNLEIGNLAFKKSVTLDNQNYGMLSGHEIERRILEKEIIVAPTDYIKINPNSVNVSLHTEIERYTEEVLDIHADNKKEIISVSDEGVILLPNECYVARTTEYTETANLIPELNGRSSTGRLGLFIHCSAGLGSIGYKGYWHLGLRVIQPLKIYPNMQMGQISYYTPDGEIINKYNGYLQNVQGPIDIQYHDTLNKDTQRVRTRR